MKLHNSRMWHKLLWTKRKLAGQMYKFLHVSYYKLIFGRHIPFAARFSKMFHSWEKRYRKGDVPVSKEVWESQYLNGYWNFLNQLDELAHYSIILGYIRFFKYGGSILDIGCGEGILQEKLTLYDYSKYVGIDISEAAINQASRKRNDKTFFINADAANYAPIESFDVIVFNEILYYFEDPLKVVERYESSLKENGIFIVSLYMTERSLAIWRRLKDAYLSVDEVQITNRSKN